MTVNSLSSSQGCELTAGVLTSPVEQVLVKVEQVLGAGGLSVPPAGLLSILNVETVVVTRTRTKWFTMQTRGVSDLDTKYKRLPRWG